MSDKGRTKATYPATNDGYDATPRGDGYYDLTIKPGVPTVTYYSSEAAPAFTIAVFSPRDDLTEEEIRSKKWDPSLLHLTLGDMPYHDIPKSLVQPALARADRADVLRETARVFDETGAEDEIYELLETYLDLMDPNDLIPEVKELLR